MLIVKFRKAAAAENNKTKESKNQNTSSTVFHVCPSCCVLKFTYWCCWYIRKIIVAVTVTASAPVVSTNVSFRFLSSFDRIYPSLYRAVLDLSVFLLCVVLIFFFFLFSFLPLVTPTRTPSLLWSWNRYWIGLERTSFVGREFDHTYPPSIYRRLVPQKFSN